MIDETCATCRWWAHPADWVNGVCENQQVRMKTMMSLTSEADFGCRFHEPKLRRWEVRGRCDQHAYFETMEATLVLVAEDAKRALRKAREHWGHQSWVFDEPREVSS